jgi:voltage-gated potassium channel
VFAFVLGAWFFLRSILEAIRDPKINRAVRVVVGLLVLGTIFYHKIEGWGWLDALYFCVVTLATVGYGDFTPATRLGKIFTMIYLLMGIGTLLALIDAVTARAMQRESGLGRRVRTRRERRASAPAAEGSEDGDGTQPAP